ncbi:ATP-dependent DNA helicase HFM1/MER3 [Paragonimus westermani]|uniref:ATP-dependent DNA helicase HFM1/MER3 n=1 Tax=Paragonimus westermani TaxID=34504 RepID=A0A5J4P0Q4_9TREM|nr:ATP-dependent DNA helicase HFM1/MER3 [Paragonimus westermani]
MRICLVVCQDELKQLQKLGLVSFDEESTEINKTELGTLVMKNHLDVSTAQMIWELKGEETLEDLVHFVASCTELKDIPLRNNEKTLLNNMNRAKGRESLRYPLPGRIVSVKMKIACLLQFHLSGNMIRDSSLQHDAVRIIRCAKRIANVLAGLLWLDVHNQNECTTEAVLPTDTTATLTKRFPLVCSTYECMVNIMELKKTLQLGTWLNRPLVSLASCPLLTSKDIDKLITSRLLTIGQIEKVQSTDLEHILGKPAPTGEQLLNFIRGIPNYSLDVEKINSAVSSNLSANVLLGLSSAYTVLFFPSKQLESSHSETEVIRFCIKVNRLCMVDTVFVLVGDSYNKLIAKHQFQSWELVETGCQKEITISKQNESQRISFTVCSTNFAGVDLHTSFVLPPREQNEAQACDSSTDAHLPPFLTEISVGYAEKDVAKDMSMTYPNNALQQHTMRRVLTAPPLSQPTSQTPTFPQRPLKKPKKVPSFKFARKRPSDANVTCDSTPKFNTTFTWIPAVSDSVPRAPLIQTSMLDYMRSQKAVSTNHSSGRTDERLTGTEITQTGQVGEYIYEN